MKFNCRVKIPNVTINESKGHLLLKQLELNLKPGLWSIGFFDEDWSPGTSAKYIVHGFEEPDHAIQYMRNKYHFYQEER